MLIVYSAYEITKIDNSYFTKIENQTFLMILRNKKLSKSFIRMQYVSIWYELYKL